MRLATQTNLPTGSQSREVFLTSEAAVVDSIAGSVLSMPYKCGGGKTREWVMLSLGPEKGGKAADGWLFPATRTSEKYMVYTVSVVHSSEELTR